MCSTDSNLKNELLPVSAGVIQGLRVFFHMHVKLGHALLQVLVQICNLHSDLVLRIISQTQLQNITSLRRELPCKKTVNCAPDGYNHQLAKLLKTKFKLC